jgi:hypothetical protein
MENSYNKLTKKYPKFVYKGYEISQSSKELTFFYNFEIPPGIQFNPKVTFLTTGLIDVSKEIIDNLAFHIGLAEIPSY